MLKRLLLAGLLLPVVCAAQGVNLEHPDQSWVRLIVNGSATSPKLPWGGGIGVFACVGTWGGATVTFEFSINDTLIVAGPATTLTANGAGVFYLPPVNIQAVVSGASGTTALNCKAGQVLSSPNA